jgi:hypothetical protein
MSDQRTWGVGGHGRDAIGIPEERGPRMGIKKNMRTQKNGCLYQRLASMQDSNQARGLRSSVAL